MFNPEWTGNSVRILQAQSVSLIGVYYENQRSSDAPAYFVSLDDARDLRKHGEAFSINHGKDIRLLTRKPTDESETLKGGTMRDSWQIKDSGGYPVWQMPSAKSAFPEGNTGG